MELGTELGMESGLSTMAMTASIGICLLALAVILLAKPLRMLLRFMLSAAAGGIVLLVGNSMGAAVGVNGVTLLTAGVLGLPGVLGLFVLSVLL